MGPPTVPLSAPQENILFGLPYDAARYAAAVAACALDGGLGACCSLCLLACAVPGLLAFQPSC